MKEAALGELLLQCPECAELLHHLRASRIGNLDETIRRDAGSYQTGADIRHAIQLVEAGFEPLAGIGGLPIAVIRLRPTMAGDRTDWRDFILAGDFSIVLVSVLAPSGSFQFCSNKVKELACIAHVSSDER